MNEKANEFIDYFKNRTYEELKSDWEELQKSEFNNDLKYIVEKQISIRLLTMEKERLKISNIG